MNDQYNRTVGTQAETDIGLKNFMLGTYRYMAMAMAVTAAVAYFGGQFFQANAGAYAILRSPFLLLGFVIAIPVLFGSVAKKLPSMSLGGMHTFLFGFAAFLGIFMSAISMYVPGMIIAKIFFMTVAMFAALSLFGYTTERNLSTYIKYAFAAFLAYVVIGVVGMFFPALSPFTGGPLGMIINIVALGAIAMITAWETQMLKRTYYGARGDALMMQKMSAFGAASLLLAFVNMFQILLSLFGRE